MKKIITAAAIWAIVGCTSARAEVMDVSTITCAEVQKMSPEEASYVMMWLHGYYGGSAGDTTIDMAALETSATMIGETCSANPDLGLMTAIKQLIGQ